MNTKTFFVNPMKFFVKNWKLADNVKTGYNFNVLPIEKSEKKNKKMRTTKPEEIPFIDTAIFNSKRLNIFFNIYIDRVTNNTRSLLSTVEKRASYSFQYS